MIQNKENIKKKFCFNLWYFNQRLAKKYVEFSVIVVWLRRWVQLTNNCMGKFLYFIIWPAIRRLEFFSSVKGQKNWIVFFASFKDWKNMNYIFWNLSQKKHERETQKYEQKFPIQNFSIEVPKDCNLDTQSSLEKLNFFIHKIHWFPHIS